MFKKCPYCGEKFQEDFEFCPNCNKELLNCSTTDNKKNRAFIACEAIKAHISTFILIILAAIIIIASIIGAIIAKSIIIFFIGLGFCLFGLLIALFCSAYYSSK